MMEEWTAKDNEEIAAVTLMRNPLPSASVKTRPAVTKPGVSNPNTTLVKCGWCGIGLLGTVETEKGTPYFREAIQSLRPIETESVPSELNPRQIEYRKWGKGDDNIWRLSLLKAKDFYGKGKTKRRYLEHLTKPKDRKDGLSPGGKGWELIFNNDQKDSIPLARIPVLAMECPRRECRHVSLVDLKLWAVPDTTT